MTALMIVLRLIHIFAGVFWAGTSFFNLSILSPAIADTGDNGRALMQHLVMRTRFALVMLTVALLTFLSGALMYLLLTQQIPSFHTTSYAIILGIGALFGLLALGSGYFMQFRVIGRMKAVRSEIEAAGGPPSPEQIGKMQALAQSAATGARVTTVLLVLALIGMSAAQYAAVLF